MTTVAAPTPTITRSTCEKYSVRLGGLEGWAIIMLDESQGLVSISSDYGSWSYLWPPRCRTEDLKSFLISMDRYYAWLKFTNRKEVYNGVKTFEAMKQGLADCPEKLERLNNYKDDIESQNFNDLQNDPEMSEVAEFHYFLCYDECPQFRMFYDRLWQPFIKYLKSEIAADEQ